MSKLKLDTDVRYISGVGSARAAALARMGVTDVRSLLRHFPRAYQHRGKISALADAEHGEVGSFLVTIAAPPKTARLKGRMTVTKVGAFDETRNCTLIFFNQPYMQDVFKTGATYRIWGKVQMRIGFVEIVSPDYEPWYEGIKLPEFTPLYPLTQGITNKYLTKIIRTALDNTELTDEDDPLPLPVRERAGAEPLEAALRGIHCPDTYSMMDRARRRFVFEELYTFALGVSLQRRHKVEATGPVFRRCDMDRFTSQLDFTLTGAQKRVVSEIENDVCDPGAIPMNRMVSGDVGCGKTVCAAAAIYMAVANGYQAALMAPTAILASQHYADLSELFGRLGIEIELLIGSTPAAKKRKIKERLASGDLRVVVGTHALISDGVEFCEPGLFVTDEQHRFGVMQRAALAKKARGGLTPHVLVMSATPIPRTLALILYGDLAVSRVDEMPPGRQKVSTFAVDESYRDRMNGFIRKQAQEGRQVYIVCPAIEAEEKDEDGSSGGIVGLGYRAGDDDQPRLKSAVEYERNLREVVFPDLRVALMHGKMKPSEKESVMAAFTRGEIDVLVSTTVIEVGVNVPNASLMIVENAERFGLSQLHQLRGRVGRGKYKSWCILVSDSKGKTARERLDVMCETNDGYKIAQRDLEIRGPGDYFAGENGARQSGENGLALASMAADMDDLTLAFNCASDTLAADPDLVLPENRGLARLVDKFLDVTTGTAN
ncbi:MAG: ATP-dependent DNA helicase RecG [Clostridia bacterium]|nr:ATP-dependent DNA helicase RecG [Clostridia bacterium]